MALLGCPFCHELRPSDEGGQCAVCGVPLVPVERLPPSYEQRAEAAAKVFATPPEHRKLPPLYAGRGRGLLTLLCLAGLAAFFLPWIHLEQPTEAHISGFELARYRAPWFWGGAVGWFILLPVVVSRRTIAEMRGVRIVAATFPSLTLIEIAVLVATRPTSGRFVPVSLSWEAGLYVSAALALVGVAAGTRFGGRVDDIRLPPSDQTPGFDETGDGETLH
jgi:hypothetical protein